MPLLTAVDSTSHVHLIIGSNPLASTRCSKSIQVGAIPIVVAPESPPIYSGLLERIDEHALSWIKRDFADSDLTSLGREDVDLVVDAVFVTAGTQTSRAADISSLCKKLRIPVNVVDSQSLSTFTILSTHSSGPVHIGVTTSGRGCKLAARIRREIASALPPDLGNAVERLGTVRRRIIEHDHAETDAEVDDDAGQSSAFNQLVTPCDAAAAKARRTRWLSQICEYWPLARLAAITDDDVEAILHAYRNETAQDANSTAQDAHLPPSALLDAPCTRGRIVLAGAGPGHPDLVTTATLKAIRSADLVLADKLVPAAVLALVPRRTPIHIARKFPGNADAAQHELHHLALAALQRGRRVLRLKQGDPFLYGRGAEEVAFFRAHGFTPAVLPGIASALAAPLFAAIPVTHRAVADSVVLCTGTGRRGAAPPPPPYCPAQTVVFLMALHRLPDLVASLLAGDPASDPAAPAPAAAPYPPTTPCAVIERASCPDQRVIRSSLRHVAPAVAELGSRPPGLLVVGPACEVLQEPLAGRKWLVEEGFWGLEGLDGGGEGEGVR